MPRTRKTRTMANTTPQTEATPPEPTPAPAAPTPPEQTGQSLFDETPSEPPAAEQPPVETAASDEPSVEDRPEGIDDAQETVDLVPDVPAAPVEEEPAAKPAGEPDAEPEHGGQSSDAPVEVRLGQVVGLLHRMPLGDVLAYADAFAEKIEALTYSVAAQDLQSRMRVSEGRCAPVYFTANDDGEPEFLLAGDDALSAAKAVELTHVFVVLIHPGDAGAVQSYLAGKLGTASASTEDDDLVWRSNGYHAS